MADVCIGRWLRTLKFGFVRERNKVHAKRSRMRRKFLLDSLREQLVGESINGGLRIAALD
jgi:hypothetical protein